MSAYEALREIKQKSDNTASLVVVPHFKFPYPWNERFTDTEGRFPLKELEEFLQDDVTGSSHYWFAKVLPEKEGMRIEYLAVDVSKNDSRLFRPLPSTLFRYVATKVS